MGKSELGKYGTTLNQKYSKFFEHTSGNLTFYLIKQDPKINWGHFWNGKLCSCFKLALKNLEFVPNSPGLPYRQMKKFVIHV